MNRKFSCDKCAKKFTYKTSLSLHLKSHLSAKTVTKRGKATTGNSHASEPQPSTTKRTSIKCYGHDCDRVFNSVDTMLSHFSKRHRDRSAERLELSIVFDSDDDLPPKYRDDATLSEPSSTSDSGTEEDEKQPAKNRKNKKKSLLTDRTCSVCRKVFLCPSKLAEHVRVHTGVRPYACSRCCMKFKYKWDLSRHTLIHTGQKPFACDLCDSKFRQKGNLITHRRTHTGEKPFRCEQCERCFSVRSTLLAHLRIHSGERRHKCTLCSKQFITSSTLKNHLKSHAEEGRTQYFSNGNFYASP